MGSKAHYISWRRKGGGGFLQLDFSAGFTVDLTFATFFLQRNKDV